MGITDLSEKSVDSILENNVNSDLDPTVLNSHKKKPEVIDVSGTKNSSLPKVKLAQVHSGIKATKSSKVRDESLHVFDEIVNSQNSEAELRTLGIIFFILYKCIS